MTLENYFANHKPVMPATVARTTADGLPTKELVDWEQYTLDFYDKTVTSLDERVDQAQSQTDDNSAAIATEIIARTDADSALASQITTVEASVSAVEASVVTEATARATADTALAADITTVEATANGATANGQVYLVAESAPSGYSAQYGWTLTAGNESIGMKALKSSGGDGYIAFFADQFALIDPSYLGGDPALVMAYNGTTFNFDVPVTIRHEEIGQNATANGAATNGNVAAGGALSVSLTTRADSRVVVIVTINDISASIHTVGFSTTLTQHSFNALVDGTPGYGAMYSLETLVASNFLGGSSYQFYAAITPTAQSFEITGLAAGGHTFGIANPTGYILGMSVQAIELAKAD
jgi:hypothetical protein